MGRETWFVLEDGTTVSPSECLTDETGKLVHKSGSAVAMRGGFHHSTGVDVGDDGNLVTDKKSAKDAKAPDKDSKPSKGRQMTAEDDSAAKYQTR